MYAVIYTVANHALAPGELIDHYSVCATLEAAQEVYELLREREDLYCAGIAKIVAGTEPHWISNEESKS